MDIVDGEHFVLTVPEDEKQEEAKRNRDILDHWLPEWMRNAFQNYSLVLQGKGMYQLAGAYKDTPAIVFGHGPSLDGALPILKDFQGSGIHQWLSLVCNSSMQAAVANGIRTDYTVLFDAAVKNGDHFIGVDMAGQKVITHTAISNTVAQDLAARGAELYWFNMLAQGRPEVFKGPARKKPTEMDAGELFTMSLIWAYGPHTGMSLPNAGCVINAALLTAANLGCRPIILVGADYGYTGMRYSATNYRLGDVSEVGGQTGEVKTTKQWKAIPRLPGEEEQDKIFKRPALRTVNGCLCGLEMAEYARSLVFLAKNCVDGYGRSLEVINCTPGGIIGDEVPRMRLEQALETFCRRKAIGKVVGGA